MLKGFMRAWRLPPLAGSGSAQHFGILLFRQPGLPPGPGGGILSWALGKPVWVGGVSGDCFWAMPASLSNMAKYFNAIRSEGSKWADHQCARMAQILSRKGSSSDKLRNTSSNSPWALPLSPRPSNARALVLLKSGLFDSISNAFADHSIDSK